MLKIFRCVVCKENSFDIICDSCQKKFLTPHIKVIDGVLSFYDYEEISFLIKYKYSKFGSRIYNILAKNSFFIFAKEIKEEFFIIPIDDNVEKGYSHTAILANSMKSSFLKPLFGKLIARNRVEYAGKDLEFRLNNKRDFEYRGDEGIDVILVDDIATTRTTLNEAKDVLKKYNVNVYLSVVLADMRR